MHAYLSEILWRRRPPFFKKSLFGHSLELTTQHVQLLIVRVELPLPGNAARPSRSKSRRHLCSWLDAMPSSSATVATDFVLRDLAEPLRACTHA
jgi:hypothetical protein